MRSVFLTVSGLLITFSVSVLAQETSPDVQTELNQCKSALTGHKRLDQLNRKKINFLINEKNTLDTQLSQCRVSVGPASDLERVLSLVEEIESLITESEAR